MTSNQIQEGDRPRSLLRAVNKTNPRQRYLAIGKKPHENPKVIILSLIQYSIPKPVGLSSTFFLLDAWDSAREPFDIEVHPLHQFW